MSESTGVLEEQGQISIQMENIFPIIKKALYSDHEIFIRELVSNSVDAINKLKHLMLIGQAEKDDSDFLIEIRLDKTNNTLTVIDNGIGMTADEVKKYINQVAFSGAKEFVEKYKSGQKGDEIIGHFGLGFYSSFMVSGKVEINTLSHKEGAESVRWSCDGSPEFSMTKGDKKERGTEIILHILDEEKDYLEEARIKHLVKKYCDFLPYQININGAKANKQKALWNEQPASLEKKDYEEFYEYLHPFSGKPRFWIHLNVDYPFDLKALLYFPHLTHELDDKGHIKLYCNNVYVSNNTEEVLPRFLTVLQGGIDSPDIPLNVSRSMLQSDARVKKIAGYISKKVADRLTEIYRKEKDDYISNWDAIQAFVKVGAMEDDKFYDQVKKAIIFANTDGEYQTLEEYLEKNKDKTEGKIYYSSDKSAQAHYINLFKDQGIDVLVLDSFIDSHFINFLEMKDTNLKFARIDSDSVNQVISHNDDSDSDLIVDPKNNKTSKDLLTDLFKEKLHNSELKVKVEKLKSEKIPGMIIFSEQMRRIHEMTSMMQQQEMTPLQDFTLVLNSNNNIIKNLQVMINDVDKQDQVELICNHVYDLALLSQKQLSPDKLPEFLERSNQILNLFSSK